MSTTTTSAISRSERRTLAIVTIAVPLVVALIGVILMLIWIPLLPAQIATHWNAAGEVDDYGSPWLSLIILLVSVPVFTAIIAGVVLSGAARGVAPKRLRLTAAMSPGFAVLMTVITTGMLGVQLDGDVSTIGGVIIGALAAGVVVGVLAWLFVPKRDRVDVVDAEVPALTVDIAPGERVVWTRTVRAPRLALVLLPVGVALVGVSLMLLDPENWWYGALLIVLAAVVGVMLTGRVTVDDTGFRVRAGLGFPIMRVPLAEVESAHATTVSSLAEFGGWGYRFDGAGRRGLVLRNGPAIEVKRRRGAVLVVTVPDAATGAAVLTALVASAAR